MPLPPLPQEDLEAVFCQVGKDWERLRGKNVFLTGGSGFFGSWLLETLLFSQDRLGLGVKVWALSRDPKLFRERLPYLAGHSSVHLAGGGVEGFDFPREKMNFVIHSMVPDPGMPLPEMEAWFEAGTARLLELAARDKCDGFLLCSTGAVYQTQGRPLREEDPLIPLDAPLSYGRIRRQVEDQCREACSARGLPLKIARGFAFAGPRLSQNAGFALVDFLKDAAVGKNIMVKGTGEPVRSYLYASDMAVWLWKILLTEQETIEFNVGSEEGIRLVELAKRIADFARRKVEVLGEPSSGAVQNEVYIPAVQKVRESLDTPAILSLDRILKKMVAATRLLSGAKLFSKAISKL
ncbi:MAG: NAD(P)-dependent oxidoreductase [Verrucomicrobia bacterium]|nr:NAD(P)-dependent oxidoreductase [Verrucomicrobiota bacterium]